MSLTTAIKTAMFAAITNARMLEDSLPGAAEAWSGVIDYTDVLQGDVAQLKLDLQSALANIDNLHNRLDAVVDDVEDLDDRIDGNEVSIMDLFGHQVTYDIFFTNKDKIIVPKYQVAQYTVHEWTVPAGEALDLGAHFSTHDNAGLAEGFRALLYSTVEGQEEQFLTMSRAFDSASRDENADTTLLYRSKVEQETKFSLRLDSVGNEQSIEADRMQFGYKTYGQAYEVNTSAPAPVTAPALPGCEINEALNERGPNRCYMNSQCAGERTCSGAGWCQGEAGCL